MAVCDLPAWFWRTFAVLFGLVWGSFLNVVIHRVPRDLSVVSPPSHCACGKPIAPYDNIPVLSWLLLRGRARCCGTKISVRYPLVEAIGGALSLAIVERMILVHPTMLLPRAGAIYGADFATALALVGAAFIDAEHMYLPDPITLGGAIVGIGTASLRDLDARSSVIGALVGFGIVWGPSALYKVVRGRTGMGLGDAKLMLLVGAWFGWVGAVFVLFAGAVQGTVAAVAIFAVKGKIEEPEQVKADREELQRAADEGDEEAKAALADDPLGQAPGEGLGQMPIPFGPFLILGFLEFLFVGQAWTDGYFGLFR